MGFVCFMCKRQFFTTKTLVRHIKFYHPFLPKYQCGQSNCDRSYKDLSGLHRHLGYHFFHSDQANSVQKTSVFDDKLIVNESNLPLIKSSIINKELSSVENNEEGIESILCGFITKLYGNSSLNRSIIRVMMNCSYELISSILTYIRNKIAAPEILDTISNDINEVFQKFATEYQILKYLKEKKLYIQPCNFAIGTTDSIAQISTPNYPEICIKTISGRKISIKEILEFFLKLPNVFKEMEAFIVSEENSDGGVYTSVFQGTLWKSVKKRFPGKSVLPILLFFDDFEPLNPLGSRAGIYKLGAVYMSLASIPPKYCSLLENIFLVQLFFASDRSTYGNEITFRNLINELKYLETEGISIEINGQKERVYFVLFLLLGDNLGLNSLLGFVESFSAEHYCRLCLAPKKLAQTEINTSNFVLRTEKNYNQDSQVFSRGVKENCIWHILSNFHITKNYSFDLMHDILEGILRYDMAYIISFLVSRKYFTLELLNNRIKYFKFSKADPGNGFPQIKFDHLRKKQLIMSASEMLAFTAYFGILVGDLVPETELVWKFYIMDLQILDILLERQFSDQLIEYLDVLIKEHHREFQLLFNENLKPKYHFLLHYPDMIRNIGPPRLYWSMRFEAFHRLLKCTAASVTCRKNLLVTLSIKQQLRVARRISINRGFENDVEFGKPQMINETVKKKFHLSKESVSVSWVSVNNVCYKKDFVLQIETDIFFQISVIVKNNTSIYFILDPLINIGFCEHVQAFEVYRNKNTENNLIKSFDELCSKQVYNIHFGGDGKCYISTIK